ncbi:MotE family protein [Paenibacillus sp. TAB 01]|uniref:MotE family protein n=1 Tax=Paenibacillus sp. TAB 01 TaxID=3368988 RepID=UPI00375094DA
MSEVDVENTSSYGAMERFLIWFLIPFVFTAVLLGVLLTIFDYDVMNGVLRAANKVPIIKSIVPEPKTTKAADPAKTPAKTAAQGENAQEPQEETVSSLTDKLNQMQQQLKTSENALQQRDDTIKELQLKNSTLEEQMKSKAQSDEEYAAQIQQLASMYAKMSPSKSAPIMENLTTAEMVLVLNSMKTDDRVKILEKMDPKKAADASILLKDQKTAKDQEIAALQERLKQVATPDPKSGQKLSKDDLGSTFANMTPKSAATVLMEMQSSNPDKVISILSSMDSAGRSRILTAISEQSKETAALISARLAQ